MTKMIQMAKVLNKYIPSEWAFKNQFNHGIVDSDLTGLMIALQTWLML